VVPVKVPKASVSAATSVSEIPTAASGAAMIDALVLGGECSERHVLTTPASYTSTVIEHG